MVSIRIVVIVYQPSYLAFTDHQVNWVNQVDSERFPTEKEKKNINNNKISFWVSY